MAWTQFFISKSFEDVSIFAAISFTRELGLGMKLMGAPELEGLSGLAGLLGSQRGIRLP
jgi:hypothetical protein